MKLLFLPNSIIANTSSSPEKLRFGMRSPVSTTTSSIQGQERTYLVLEWT
jgi:hypothetical protein